MTAMDWNHIRAFHATATAGSLSAAARHLGLTQPTLSRQVAALEAALGVALFDRVGRKLVLSQIGAELLARIGVMADTVDLVALTASGRVQEISGKVSISATDTYSAYILPAMIERIRKEAPLITIAVVASNELSNLHRRDADIAIRHVAPDRPGLIGQHVRDTEAYFYASDDWIARNIVPLQCADLSDAGLIALEDTARFARYLQDIGIPVERDRRSHAGGDTAAGGHGADNRADLACHPCRDAFQPPHSSGSGDPGRRTGADVAVSAFGNWNSPSPMLHLSGAADRGFLQILLRHRRACTGQSSAHCAVGT